MKNMLVGHSSFYLRVGWIKKGIEYIEENNEEYIFSKQNIKAIDFLGIGSVMVQSLKFWLELLDVVYKKDKKYYLNRNIDLIIKKDPYFENLNTLWLLHIYIMERKNKEEIPVLWELFIRNKKINVFTEDNAREILEIYLKENEIGVSERSIKDSISVFIKTYFNQKNKIDDPEDNLYSPFSKLNYLEQNEDKGFYFRNIESNEITEYIIFYLLFLDSYEYEKNQININENYQYVNSIIRMKYLEYMKLLNKLENKNYISIDRAAGLNSIKVINKLSEEKIIKRILESEN